MFGALIRAAPTAAVGVLFGAILSEVIAPIMAQMGPQDGLLYSSFAAIDNHAVLIMALSVVFGLLARSVTESALGGI